MSANDIAEFEAQLVKLIDHWRFKMTHAALVGTIDNVKINCQLKTIQGFDETEKVTAPVKVPKASIVESLTESDVSSNKGSPTPVTHKSERERIARDGGSPLPNEIGNGSPTEVADG